MHILGTDKSQIWLEKKMPCISVYLRLGLSSYISQNKSIRKITIFIFLLSNSVSIEKCCEVMVSKMNLNAAAESSYRQLIMQQY